MIFIRLPFYKFDETMSGTQCAKHPGTAAGVGDLMAHVMPEARVVFRAVQRNASMRNEQIVLQRISQMIPIAIVPMPVN